jgi:hypothetical protein
MQPLFIAKGGCLFFHATSVAKRALTGIAFVRQEMRARLQIQLFDNGFLGNVKVTFK